MQLEKAAITQKRTVSAISHHRDGNFVEPIYCPTTGDPCEGKISDFCDNHGRARESGLANLWTHLNRPSNYKLTSCCESDQAEQESGHTESLIRCESALNDLLTNRGKPCRRTLRTTFLRTTPNLSSGIVCVPPSSYVPTISPHDPSFLQASQHSRACAPTSATRRVVTRRRRVLADGDEVLAVERYGARNGNLARALVAERTAQKPTSPLNQQFQRRLAS